MSEIRIVKKMKIWILVCGIFSIIFYVLHDIIGALSYPGYKWMEQAVSDLTATDAPSRTVAGGLTKIHAIFNCICCAFIVVLAGNKRKSFRIGVYLFALMHAISAIGYALFPLTGSGYDGSFSSFMHVYVVTALVVLLAISSLVLIAVGSFKDKNTKLGILSIVALALMMTAPVSFQVPKEIFGVIERLTVYSSVLFTGVLSVYFYRDDSVFHNGPRGRG